MANRIDQLLVVVERFSAAKGVSESRISTLVFGSGSRVKSLRAGTDMGVRTVETALKWFSDRWPENTAWPESVARPAVSDEVAEASQ